jgi:hypothetical protein
VSVSPIFIQDKKSTSRAFQAPVVGINDELPGINRYRWFRAASLITAGQWVGLNMTVSDLHTVLPVQNPALVLTFAIGVAVDGATGGEASAGKLVKVQIAGFHPAASVTTGGAAGWWAVLGATAGRADAIDPTALTPTAAEVRGLGDRVGMLLEAAAANVASVWIFPRL